MPFYDYIYDTMDQSSDTLYENSLKRKEETPNVVHLTHLTTPESIYHLRFGFASLASKPYSSAWYLWLLWPVTLWSMVLTRIYRRTFVVERNRFHQLRLQTWAIPKYGIQYRLKWQKESVNNMIEEAVLDAEEKELNRHGEVYVKKHPQLKVKLVDGSSLAVAVLLNSIPKGTTQVLLRGNLTKVAFAVAFALCQKGIQVTVLREDEYEKLDKSLGTISEGKLVTSKSYSSCKVWLVGDDLTEEEQRKANKGTLFIPFSQLPPKKLRKDCFYHTTPAMQTPTALENVDSCENWLPRRVMSVWRIAGILHALEGWEEHECGYTMSNIDKVWEACFKHGFQPLKVLKDRLKQRINNWSIKHLSQGGKEVFIKAVLQAIPTYTMSFFLLPKLLCSDLENIMNSFWWDKNGGKKGMHWCSWKALSVAKEAGGMFRDLNYFNIALLAKRGWRLLRNPNSLLAHTLKAKYYKNSDFIKSELGNLPSFTWKSLWATKGLILQGMGWRIGDGKAVSIWNGNWLSGNETLNSQNTDMNTNLENVADLFESNMRRWDEGLVHNTFTAIVAEKILSIPLSRNLHEDFIIWQGEPTGELSVRSGYRLPSQNG
ncbi:protein ECERIFERUM 1-like [Gossypium australe]|uniref:Protein ECERIFERUM 1-like n=1 Tax=Gossypium australe TaxID=47621 RepID=A0A5B6WA41_9ROSI|nr:protein ECERIFERUM 1-like [Gossypium australe]